MFHQCLSNRGLLVCMAIACMFIASCDNLSIRESGFAINSKDYANQIPHITNSAEAGDPKAEHILGYMYLNGLGVDQNIERAVYWFEKSAEKNNSDAERALHAIYIDGFEGVEKNSQRAIYMITRAAINGDVLSQAILGEMYLDAHGVEQNYDLAKFWLERSDKQNSDGNAAYELGKMYLNGIGVNKDLTNAKIYLERAKVLGHPDADEIIKEIK